MLLSAGIGATPVLAMLLALAAASSTRQVLRLYAARDPQHHPFATEVRRRAKKTGGDAHQTSHIRH
jgi:ferredoxin-NADP reductase